jgi:hypothetical protein
VLLKTLDNGDKWHGKCLMIGGNVLADRLNCRKCSGMCGVSADRSESVRDASKRAQESGARDVSEVSHGPGTW